ncbi:helix-turn-helix domain-containing protein [Granulicella aggregans]|jgi:transcriptional regulator with XRE-family HTH domain|uniref:helix-turn-helix domain-containing protein n=1 Tax=Granulicella aggregans TaxID=474949 RepID=UPI0021E05BA7|nr:XRE family transcriptional regulator [Granulicella aggregans]
MPRTSALAATPDVSEPVIGSALFSPEIKTADLEQAGPQVDGEAAESFIAEKRIGERIKHLRLKKSMGLVELGRHTGLSASFLSQLETGRVVPTLRNLARIAMVFSKDLSYFFEPEPQTLFRVHRAKDRVRLPQSGVADPCYFFESLGYMVPDRQLDPYFAEFLPAKKGREARAHQHTGCEFLFLLSGRLDIQHGEVTHHIDAGDAIYFDADTVHSYQCSGEESATAIIVTLQQPIPYTSGRAGHLNGASPNRGRTLPSAQAKGRPDGQSNGDQANRVMRKTGASPVL